MEVFVEIIMELLFEGIHEAGTNGHVPYILRCFFRFLYVATISSVLCLMGLCGILMIKEENPAGILFVILTLAMAVILFFRILQKKSCV